MKENINKIQLWKCFAYLVMFLGISLRLAIYFQNRNLFQDEANITRNIYERNFCDLLAPLSYQQYAPPLFLWILKGLTTLFGFSEFVLKLVPLASGIGSIILLYKVLRKYSVKQVVGYPLLLFSTGLIYLRYSTELKQYSSDTFIALALIYCALSINVDTTKLKRFVFIWLLLGSLAIWSSMTSVFILAGVALYYFIVIYRSSDAKRGFTVLVIVAIWLFQFLGYYMFILRAEINSDYLQTFHKTGFLILLPKSKIEFLWNWDIISNLFAFAAGAGMVCIRIHMVLILVALYCLFRRRNAAVVLLIVPVILLLLAASCHQYALAPRGVLFVFPLILILIAIGFQEFFAYKYLRIVLVALALVNLFYFNELKYFSQPLKNVELTESMDFLVGEGVKADQLYVHPLALPAFIYYTEINPRKSQWSGIRGAHPLNYKAFESLAQTMNGKSAILYGYIDPAEVNRYQKRINKRLITLKHYSTVLSQAYIYTSP